jgi:SAM-dependent methyltransferase
MLSESECKAFSDFEKRGWDKAAIPYHDLWGMVTRQSSQALLDAARVQTESKVLDLATGAGYVAAAARQRGAMPIGVDFSSPQVELARKTYPSIEFRQGDAENLPLEDCSFDAVVMGLGLLHLPHAERAVAETFRVLKPGGFFAATVWAKPEDNPAFRIVLSAIECYGAKVDLPPGPPLFRFADHSEAERVLSTAGFIEPQMRLVPQYWRHTSADQLFDVFSEGGVRITAVLRAQTEQTRQKIKQVMREAVLPLVQDGVYVILAPVALMSARKP